MVQRMTFADRALQFNDMLALISLDLPTGFRIVNPFQADQKAHVRSMAETFYRKYYDDAGSRRLILGSSPARRGTAVSGIPFEGSTAMTSSSGFLDDVITQYGGRRRFYADFYMNFVCLLGIVRVSPTGCEVNCNYYENKELQEALYPFIIDTLRCQVGLGIDASVCYCIGSGQNFHFLSQVNKEFHFFGSIVPLEHPRFVVQYSPGRKDEYIARYVEALRHERP